MKNDIYHFMSKENEVDEELEEEPEDSDTTDWKSEAQKLREKAIAQRERTKALKDKIAELEKAKEPEKKSDEELMKRLDTMALRVAGITADDEKELFEKWKGDTGRDADSIVENKIFQAELADLRTAKANVAATTNIKGEGGSEDAKSDPKYWIARATKDSNGELLFPDNMPHDLDLHSAIVAELSASSKGNKEFYNSK